MHIYEASGMQNYPWPPVPGCSETPIWTGSGFQTGQAKVPILCYEIGASGWTDELTELHEEAASDDHPIDRASRRHALEQIRQYSKCQDPAILEVGCSSGFMLRFLRENFPENLVIGADYVSTPLHNIANEDPSQPLLQFDLASCPLPANSLDVVVLLNVLEHIENDAAAIRQVWRILKPGGVAIIEVPAGPHLYDIFDKQLLHFRRYDMHSLCALLSAAGFETVHRSHLGFFVYPAFWLAKKRNRGYFNKDYTAQRQRVIRHIKRTRTNVLMNLAMSLEIFLGKIISYPAGVRCLVTCRKKD
jgi:SAM-dependent methyltransferase